MVPPADQPFVGKLSRSLRRRCGVGEGDRLVVAVSGGADSTALLRGLAALAGRRRWRLELVVGHVNHHLRETADEDAAFVQALAAELGLSYCERDIAPGANDETRSDGGGDAAEGGETNLEAKARRLRYTALAEIAQQVQAHFVVTAHHGDDQLETLLMRFMLGSSGRWLRGIAWRRAWQGSGEPMPLIRPMLDATHAEATQFLEAIGQSWCEDATNQDRARWRARLRRQVLPVLRDMQPDVAQKATEAADHFRELHTLLRRQAQQARCRAVETSQSSEAGADIWRVDRAVAERLPRLTLDTVLRDLLIEAGVPRDRLSKQTLRPMVDATRDGKGGCRRFDLPGGVTASLDRTALCIEKTPNP